MFEIYFSHQIVHVVHWKKTIEIFEQKKHLIALRFPAWKHSVCCEQINENDVYTFTTGDFQLPLLLN
jgi:hypothetical protein